MKLLLAEDCPPGDGALKLPNTEPGSVGQFESCIGDGDRGLGSGTGLDEQRESEHTNCWGRAVRTVIAAGERARLCCPLEITAAG